MKKVILLTAILLLSNVAAMAIIDSDYATSDQYLRNCGYSPETIRLINIKKKSPYSPPEEITEETIGVKSVGWVKKFWHYLDPAADNGTFGNSIINPDAASIDDL